MKYFRVSPEPEEYTSFVTPPFVSVKLRFESTGFVLSNVTSIAETAVALFPALSSPSTVILAVSFKLKVAFHELYPAAAVLL